MTVRCEHCQDQRYDGLVTAHTPYHHGDLSEALAVEALAQLKVKGSQAVSLRGVAQAVGVSASAAYNHFPDKTSLMQEVGHRGSLEFDQRIILAVGSVPGRGRLAAVGRMRAIGAAYVGFAVDEPHLFRHIFSAECASDVPPGPEQTKDSAAYSTLGRCLDDLARLGVLRPAREGLELLAWTSVHGFASLVIEGIFAPEAAELMLDTLLGAVLQPATAR